MFLGGVFVPAASLPLGMQAMARALPLTYGVEVLHVAMAGGERSLALLDLAVLAAFTVVFFGLASWILARRVAWNLHGSEKRYSTCWGRARRNRAFPKN